MAAISISWSGFLWTGGETGEIGTWGKLVEELKLSSQWDHGGQTSSGGSSWTLNMKLSAVELLETCESPLQVVTAEQETLRQVVPLEKTAVFYLSEVNSNCERQKIKINQSINKNILEIKQCNFQRIILVLCNDWTTLPSGNSRYCNKLIQWAQEALTAI